jgi:hypothetical protein
MKTMSVDHERALRLRSLVPKAPVEIPWRTHGLLLRIVFFGLTCVGVAALNVFLDLIGVPKQGLVVGVVAIAIAEVLIRNGWWWTGVEEALWIGGVFSMITELPSSGTPESNLVLAAAAAIPGVRLRNPLFGVIAAAFVVTWFEKRLDLGVIAALVLAMIAVVALLRTWKRPSTEWLWVGMAVVLPVVGSFYADARWHFVTLTLYAAFAVSAMACAILKRHHALFLSGGVALAIALIEGHRHIPLLLEAKLAVLGAILLAGSWILARALRGRTTGVVVTPAALTPFDDAVEIAATVNVPQPEFAPPAEAPGGEFGGAGATGKY